MAELIMAEGATPATPSTGKATLFINTSGKLCVRDDVGNVFVLASLSESQTFTTQQQMAGGLALTRSDLTIASGEITVASAYHRVDTEGAAATDDLVTINGGTTVGQILVLQSVNDARDVTVKNATGNIFLAGTDFVLSNILDKLFLIFSTGNQWHEIARSNNGA